MDAHLGQRTRLHLLTGGTTYADVLRVQAVLAPGRRDAVVEVGARPSHVQLLLVRLGGDVVPGRCPLGQELIKRWREREVPDGSRQPAGRRKDWISLNIELLVPA